MRRASGTSATGYCDMHAALNKLNKIEGVQGSLVAAKDGLVIVADVGNDLDENVIGAIGSSVLGALLGALKRMNMGQFSRFIVTGREGKIVIANSGEKALLIVLLDKDANIGLVSVEIREALQEIGHKLHL